MERKKNYKAFLRFVEENKNTGFKDIDEKDPLLIRLEKMMAENNQFFYILDFTRLNIVFTSKRSKQLIGLEPEHVNPRTIFDRTHPKELKRHNVARSKMFQLTNEMHANPQDDFMIASTNYRFLNLQGKYNDLLIQGYVFKVRMPELNIYGMLLHTDLSKFGKINYGYNHYLGNDKDMFRYPDQEYILTGRVFTKREFEILELLKTGHNSEQIAEKLFLSTHTIDTHRRNIIKKTGNSSTTELIYELQEKGFF